MVTAIIAFTIVMMIIIVLAIIGSIGAVAGTASRRAIRELLRSLIVIIAHRTRRRRITIYAQFMLRIELAFLRITLI